MTLLLAILPNRGNSGSLPAGTENFDPFVLILLLLLGLIAAVGIGFVFLARHHVRQREKEEEFLASQFTRFNSPLTAGARSIFGLPKRWIAIRSTNQQAVRDVFRLNNVRTCSWEEGLAEASQSKLFISPPVGSWILVMGTCLPDAQEDVDHCFRFLNDLSEKLGHVQYFLADRVLYHHAWVRAENGRILRAYAWADETIWNQGHQTIAEMELGLVCLEYGEQLGSDTFPPAPFIQANTEKVVALAANWSVDPLTVDQRALRLGQGLAGEVSSTSS